MATRVPEEGLPGSELPAIWSNYANVATGFGTARIAFGEITGSTLNMRAVMVMPLERARQLAEILLSMVEKQEAKDGGDENAFKDADDKAAAEAKPVT